MFSNDLMRILTAFARAWSIGPRQRHHPGMLVGARGERGLTVSEAAEQIGISKGTLMRAEHGQHVRPAKLALIAAFYGIPVGDLVDGESD
jgi:DNA-binding XRE family transcriptional regulator